MGASACSCTERSQEGQTLPGEDEFIADNTLLRANTVGLVFRKSMDMEDRCADEFVLWGNRVRGIQMDSLWVKVGKRYVPMFLNEIPVLTRGSADAVTDAGEALAEMDVERTHPSSGGPPAISGQYADIFTLEMLSREMETEESTPLSSPRPYAQSLSASQIFSDPVVQGASAVPALAASDSTRRLSLERLSTADFGDDPVRPMALLQAFGAEKKQNTVNRLAASGFADPTIAEVPAPAQAEARSRSKTPPAKDGKKRKKDKSKTPPRSRDDRDRRADAGDISPGRASREKDGAPRSLAGTSKVALLRERMVNPEGRNALRLAQDAESAGLSAEAALEQADRDAAEAEAQRAARKKVPRGRVTMLQKSMSTVEGRQQLRAAEGETDGQSEASVVPSMVPLHPPPVERLGETKWHIKGMYEHQVLKLGLRLVDKEWDDTSILELPRDKDGKMSLFRPGLFTRLLDGSQKLKSVPGNDLSAAQPDLRKLSLRQLLRIRVSHLDFVPSGCGADSINSVGATHQAFLSTLDGLLFQRLGLQALGDAAPDWIDKELGPDNKVHSHRLGREAILLVAAASAVMVPPRWVWWLRDDCRVFFHVGHFSSEADFPPDSEGGVLEVVDCSKRDQHEPTGQLRWLDWRVELVTSETRLSPERPRLPGSAAPPATRGRGATPRGGGDRSPRQVESSGAVSLDAGAAAADLMSAEVLQSKRSQLKKTGGAVS